MSDIRFIQDYAIVSVDQRVPVVVISVDASGTALIEDYSGRRHLWGADKLLPAECYLCNGMHGEMKITAYGGAARLRCVHVGACPGMR